MAPLDGKRNQPRGLAPIDELVDVPKTLNVAEVQARCDIRDQEVIREHPAAWKAAGDEHRFTRATASVGVHLTPGEEREGWGDSRRAHQRRILPGGAEVHVGTIALGAGRHDAW